MKALIAGNPDDQTARLFELDRLMIPSDAPWSEVTRPRLVIEAIRFITAGVALVDAANVQYGSIIVVRRAPVIFVLKRVGKSWRIAEFRAVADCYETAAIRAG